MKRFALPILAALAILTFAWAQSTRVGPNPSADSLAINQRLGRTGETITQASGGINKERVRRGACFYASDNAAGVAVPTAVGTTAFLSLYNPVNSNTLIIVKKVYAVYFSGTLGTGVMYHCITGALTTAPSGGTLQTANCAMQGAGAQTPVGVVRTGATVTAPAILAPFIYLSPELATTVTAPQQTFEDLDDAVQIGPGCNYQLQAVAAAGTSPKLSPAVFWEEQPFLNGQP